MGHVRLCTLPNTKPWQQVIALIAEGEGADVVAGATSAAAVHGLLQARLDPGLTRSCFLLVQCVLAAREPDFAAALATHQLTVPAEPGLFDLTAGFTEAVRRWHVTTRTPRTDLGEMASLAAVEALTQCVGMHTGEPFPAGNVVRRITFTFSTPDGFPTLAHEFYARFTRRFLLYHLGRELSQHVGGNGRFTDPAAHTAFIADLDTHCREATQAVREYAGSWYKQADLERGITVRGASRFSARCLQKLRDELERRGARDG